MEVSCSSTVLVPKTFKRECSSTCQVSVSLLRGFGLEGAFIVQSDGTYPTTRVSCVARIYSGIPPIDNEQTVKLIESRGKAKTVVKVTTNLIKRKLLISLHNKVSDSKIVRL
jgi:hypothetical protein